MRKNRYLFISKVCILLNRYKIEVKLNNEVAGWMGYDLCSDPTTAMRLQHFLFVHFLLSKIQQDERREACHAQNKQTNIQRFSHTKNAIAHRDRLREQKDTRLGFRFHRIDVCTFHFHSSTLAAAVALAEWQCHIRRIEKFGNHALMELMWWCCRQWLPLCWCLCPMPAFSFTIRFMDNKELSVDAHAWACEKCARRTK